MRAFRPVSLGVAAVLVLALIAGLVSRSAATGTPFRVAQVAPGCMVETDLVRNGSFESPGFSGQIQPDYVPDDWVGVVDAVSASRQPLTDGLVYIFNLRNGLTQELDTAGLDGATLAIRYITNRSSVVRLGGEAPPPTSGPNGVQTATYTVPNPAPLTTTLALSGMSIDDVSVTVATCPVVPTATATATTAPTATATTATTATTAPTATATATATAVPTPPVITLIGGVQDGQTYARRQLPPAPTCTAVDDVDGPVACTQSGYQIGFGTHTITYRAVDAAGNEAVETVTYTVAERAGGPTATPRPPTAVPTLRPTERPRPNPTATAVPVEPTARPTQRPRNPELTVVSSDPGTGGPGSGGPVPLDPAP